MSPIFFLLAFALGMGSLFFCFTSLSKSIKQKNYSEIVVYPDSASFGCRLKLSSGNNSIDTIYLGKDYLVKESGIHNCKSSAKCLPNIA